MKKWYQSKTLWVNVLVLAGVVAEYLITNQLYLPEVHAVVLAVINLGLRFTTGTKLSKQEVSHAEENISPLLK